MAVLKSSFPALGALTTGCWREIQEASSPRELAKQRSVKGASIVLKSCWIEFLGPPVGFGNPRTLKLWQLKIPGLDLKLSGLRLVLMAHKVHVTYLISRH